MVEQPIKSKRPPRKNADRESRHGHRADARRLPKHRCRSFASTHTAGSGSRYLLLEGLKDAWAEDVYEPPQYRETPIRFVAQRAPGHYEEPVGGQAVDRETHHDRRCAGRERVSFSKGGEQAADQMLQRRGMPALRTGQAYRSTLTCRAPRGA